MKIILILFASTCFVMANAITTGQEFEINEVDEAVQWATSNEAEKELPTRTPAPNQISEDEKNLTDAHYHSANALQEEEMASTASNLVLDQNTFFIINYRYRRARLAQYGTSGRHITAYEQAIYPDQLWYLDESSRYPGYYYIVNTVHRGYRLAKWSSRRYGMGVYNGRYYDDQLWRFRKEGNGYRIYNKVYPRHKLTQFTKSGRIGTYAGGNSNDQLWRLVPRFSVRSEETKLWGVDNRQGTRPITHTERVIRGMRMTRSSTMSTKFGLELALKSTIKFAFADTELSTKFTHEVSHSITNSDERYWSSERTIVFTCPAGKNYRVWQTRLSFDSDLSRDNLKLYTQYRVEESS